MFKPQFYGKIMSQTLKKSYLSQAQIQTHVSG